MSQFPLISVSELKQLLAKDCEDILILDCSHDLVDAGLGQREYEKAHLPGAVFVPMDEVMSGIKTGTNGRHPLPERQQVVDFMQSHGANDTTLVIVYDRSQGLYASRVWWTLRWLGHADVKVLDGGLQAWQAAGQAVSQDLPASKTRGNFSERPSLASLVTFEDVMANLETRQRLVVDARAHDRFRGENETLDPVGGHIPGAVNRPFKFNLNEDGTFKDGAKLASEFADLVGSRRGNDLIMQCGSGVSACHNLLALVVAGMGDAPLYVGSWSEWCSRPGAPIARGD